MSWFGYGLDGLGISAPVLLVAVCLASLTASLRVLSVAVGGIVVLGELAAIWGSNHFGFAGFALASIIVCVALFLGVEMLVLRPQRSRVWDVEMGSFAATLGVGFLLTGVAAYLTSSNNVALPSTFLTYDKSVFVFGISVPVTGLIDFAIAFVLCFMWDRVLRVTSIGRKFRAVAANRVLAREMGVSSNVVALQATIASGILCGVAALMVILDSRGTNAYSSSDFLLLPFVAVIIGGLGSVRAAGVAAVILGVVEGVLPPLISSPGIQDTIVFGLMFVILAIRPDGLVRRAVESREF